MTDEDIQLLLERYKNGTCTAEECATVDRWYQSESTKRAMPSDPDQPVLQREGMWQHIQATITQRSQTDRKPLKQHRRRSGRGRFVLGMVASLLIILSTATYLYWIPNYRHHQELAKIRQNDVLPGANRAILTLADGTAIVLDSLHDEEIARMLNYPSEGVTRSAETEPLYNTLSTPRGGQYQMTLPDGTEVWLNAASSLTFPTAFSGSERKVQLKGEAYFEVAKNKQKPFKVISHYQEVRVLGTHFNISSYEDESVTTTTVLEGSVQVFEHNKVRSEPETLVLKPGESAILSAHTLRKTNAKTEEIIDWKNGKFQFTDESIETLMPKIARWYNIEIAYEGEMPTGRFSGQVSRSHKLSQILEILQTTDLVHFRMEEATELNKERRIVVLP